MAKDKKKKDKKDKPADPKKGKKKSKSKTGTLRLQTLRDNPIVADVVAAALVATAAALRDPRKARQLAAQTGDELTELAKEGADRGAAMWQLAMEVGRRSLDALASASTPAKRGDAKDGKMATAAKPASPAKPVGKAKAKTKASATRRSTTKPKS